MKLSVLKGVLPLAVALLAASGAFAADPAPGKAPAAVATTAKADAKVTIAAPADGSKAKDVFESLAKQTQEKIIVESSVKGDVKSVSLTDVSLESALTAVCKAGKWEWRKVYIGSDSKLLEQPDKLASTVRLMLGLSFPDMLVAGSSMDRYATHFNDKASVLKSETSLAKELGMVRVYLITDDVALAAKALADEKSKKVSKYADLQKQQMDAFMDMSPEEREQAIMDSLNMMDQVSPQYMSDVMQSLMSDPDALRQIMSKQTDFLFDMSQDQRRAIIKMQMQMGSMFTPEQQQMLQEDSQAVMEEIKAEQGAQGK